MYPKAALDKFTVTNVTFENFKRLNWNGKLALASSFERVQYLKSKSYFDLYFFNYPNQIHTYAPKFLMRPRFSFANELNKFIEQASNGGLINKWLKRYQLVYKGKDSNGYMYIKIENLALLLCIFVIIWLFTLFVLMIERIVFRKVRMVGSNRFWRYVEILIDPDRHFLMNKYI